MSLNVLNIPSNTTAWMTQPIKGHIDYCQVCGKRHLKFDDSGGCSFTEGLNYSIKFTVLSRINSCDFSGCRSRSEEFTCNDSAVHNTANNSQISQQLIENNHRISSIAATEECKTLPISAQHFSMGVDTL